MEPVIIFWIVLAVIFVIAEGLSTNLVTIWMAFGAVAAAIAAVCGLELVWQILIFVIVSLILLLLTRPLAKKLLKKDKKPTNADRLIGGCGLVIETIDPLQDTGTVKIDGKIWTARSQSGIKIREGETVVVKEIEGVKLIVVPQITQ